MLDTKRGAFAGAIRTVLSIISILYGTVLCVRDALIRAGAFKVRKVCAPVISVGNLTFGGTGKTPFVIMLSRLLRDSMKKSVAVLIRGYGEDETALLKESLPDELVLVGRDRAATANEAVRARKDVTIILDDGFQHRALSRDIDIVLIDTRNPFGNNRLCPRGILREPVRNITRASICVLTKTDRPLSDVARIENTVRSYKNDILIVRSAHLPVCFIDERSSMRVGLDFIEKKRVFIVSGIGDPGYFQEMVQGLGGVVAGHLRYPDHHGYPDRDLDEIRTGFDAANADCIVTTEKDMTKLRRLAPKFRAGTILSLRIEMRITDGEDRFVDRLHSLYTG